MKWIKSRRQFIIDEAKIRDVILPIQARQAEKNWGEKWLDLEEIEPSDKIVQGKWKLTNEEKKEALGIFFTCDIDNVYSIFESLPEKFVKAVNDSIDLNLFDESDKFFRIMNNLDFKQPSINQISVMTDPVFRKISVSETMSDEIIVRDDTGRPVRNEDGTIQKMKKEEGAIIYSKNLVNINTFVDDFNRCFPDTKIDATKFLSGDISRLVSKSREDFSGEGYQVEVDVYNKDMFLSIRHNPKDILNMSISRFYSSCQNLYSGGFRDQLLGNVFDPNSCPAFLLFDTPIHNNRGELISEQLPISRMIVRHIEGKDDFLFFDRAYPDRMQDFISKIVTKYSGMIHKDGNETYMFYPDIPVDEFSKMKVPYMDRLGVKKGLVVGINAKNLVLSDEFDWSKVKILPKVNLEEIIIETENIPENFFELKLSPKWIKFKFLKINTLQFFNKIETKSLAFDKCKVEGSTILEYKKMFPEFKNLQIVSSMITNFKLSDLGKMNEIHLVYSIDDEYLSNVLEGVDCKKLVLSGDLVSTKENKEFINSLRRSGVSVQITGLKI